MRQFVAVFDNAPLAPSAWMKGAAEALGLTLVSQGDVADELSKNPEFVKKVMSPEVKSLTKPDPSLAPFYKKALDAKYPQQKLALHGWGWLVLSEQVDAVVLDFIGLEQDRKKVREGIKQKQQDEHFLAVKSYLVDQAKKRVTPDRLLQLQTVTSEPDKQKQALEFVKRVMAVTKR